MARKNHLWSYSNVDSSRHGTMQCATCGKKVSQGKYRYRMGRTGYVINHRECCLDDPYWAAQEAQHRARQAHHARVEQACRDFYRKYRVRDLEDYLSDDEMYAIDKESVPCAS